MKLCIACAEEIRDQAQLCKHCGTLQDDAHFSKVSQNQSQGMGVEKNKRTNVCPKCDKNDNVSRVSAIVDQGRVNSASVGLATQLGHPTNAFSSFSAASSSTLLADRLSIYYPEAEFNYKFRDFALGVFICLGMGFWIFKTGSPVDAGPMNPLFAFVTGLFLGPLAGILFAIQRKKNLQEKLWPQQILISYATEALRDSYYCSRDDLVFNDNHFETPENFIDYLLEQDYDE